MLKVNVVADRLQDDRYTGENRCWPCTTVNTALTGALAAGGGFVDLRLGVVFACTGLLAITFRGYLVPGTPALTKRYMPTWMLEWFKRSAGHSTQEVVQGEMGDPEEVLNDLGLLTLASTEPALTEEAGQEWADAVESTEDPLQQLADLFGVDEAEFTGIDPVTLVDGGGYQIAEWPSQEAAHADVGALELLRSHGMDASQADNVSSARFLSALRLLADRCPVCRGTMQFSERRVESCCSVHNVVSNRCKDCGSRLAEVNTK